MRRLIVLLMATTALVVVALQPAFATVTTHVSIAYNHTTDRFHGAATSANAECKAHRTVRLYKKTANGPVLRGHTTTGTRGGWSIKLANAHGHFYARIPPQTVMNVKCSGATSPTIDVM